MTIGQKKRIFIVMVMVAMAVVTGCSRQENNPPVAGLRPLDQTELARWGGEVQQQGQGNTVRVVAGSGLGADNALELAAGQGSIVYTTETEAGREVIAHVRLQFLSTQGTGRMQIAALDSNNNVIAAVGWVITGQMPPPATNSLWVDKRSNANYKGDWLTAEYPVAELLASSLPNVSWQSAKRYRIRIETGEGQHVLITRLAFTHEPANAIVVSPVKRDITAQIGDTVSVTTDVINSGSQVARDVAVDIVEPYGYGAIAQGPRRQVVSQLEPGGRATLTWQVKAQRAHAVNFGNPWHIGFAINGVSSDAAVSMAVADPRPGKIFYVMTEDLEAIDSAGYAKAWGNADGWLQPQEVLGQMVGKAEALNKVADQYGAKWTHYIAWPLIRAAEWAAGQSADKEWSKVAPAVRESVQIQSNKGHEYGLHLHSDYDPNLPGNVLSYNQQVNGFWANHLKHGWAHSISTEGDFSDYNSRTGILYAYQRIIDQLSAQSSHGQLITTRVGSFDFGNGSQDEAISTKAYHKVGLWAGSDADGNTGGITAGDYGGEIYFTKPDDINKGANRLDSIGIVQFKPTPQMFINYDSQSDVVMNRLADQGMMHFTTDGKIKPGVHGITGFTHAMFVMGNGDWQSTEGGQFAAIAGHLDYLKQNYVDGGKLIFATAGELTSAFLDYYTPQPVALYGPLLSKTAMVSEYAIQILGQDIPIDASHSHIVSLKYPLYLRDSAYRVSVLKNGQPIYSTWGLPTPYNDILFTADDGGAKYTLKVYHNELIFRIVHIFRSLKTKLS